MMMDAFQAFLILIGACFSAGCIGASFIFGAVLVCQRMNWSPVNLVVNLNDYRPVE